MARSSAPNRLLRSWVLTPGATRSSVACGTPSSSIFSMPSAGITFSMPATVICNSPSRRPLAVRPSVPAATATRSPCAIRDCTISTCPPAACNSRNRSGQGFGEKSFNPLSSVRTSASNGCAKQRMHLLHAAALDLQHGLDHGMIGASSLRRDGRAARHVWRAPAASAPIRWRDRFPHRRTRSRRAAAPPAGRPRWSGRCASSPTSRAPPRESEIVAGAVNSAISSFGS